MPNATSPATANNNLMSETNILEQPKAPLAVGCDDLLAWEVELHDMTCVCFASTKAKAQWLATKSYWEAYGRRKGEWPRAAASRAPQHDKSALRFEKRQKAWSPDYVLGYPSR